MKLRTAFITRCMYTMFILLSMTSCRWYNAEDDIVYDRTVLVYMAADNNLSSFLQEDIDEMLNAADEIPTNCRLIIYVDDADLPRILSVEQQDGRRPVSKLQHQYTIEHNSGDTETLHLAMEWVIENSPSESYGLVMWSHGSSWIPAKAPIQRAACLDSNSDSWMEMEDIADVLEQSPRFEFIMFDACFMQAIEVAYELRKIANYIISSPAEIPGPGAPYNRMIAPMFSFPIDTEELVDAYYLGYREDEQYGVCLSAIDCSHLDALATTTAEMVVKYASKETEINTDSIQRYNTVDYNQHPEYYDMNGYMARLITDEYDYAYWKSAFDKAVPHKRTTSQWYSMYTNKREHVDIENYGGISCYIPKDKSTHTTYNENFRSTAWYKVSGWELVGW